MASQLTICRIDTLHHVNRNVTKGQRKIKHTGYVIVIHNLFKKFLLLVTPDTCVQDTIYCQNCAKIFFLDKFASINMEKQTLAIRLRTPPPLPQPTFPRKWIHVSSRIKNNHHTSAG